MKNFFFVTIFILLNKVIFAITGISETPFTDYKFDAKECKVITHHKSRILIPSYTFYLDGKLYEGEVNLKYREFTDQLDIVLNNIPMNYAANDKTHVLESGGMFELYAYGNGKLLSFANDKKVSVQLATKFDIAGGETFKLNPTTKNWEKKTLFANVADANVQLPIDKKDMWNDNLWQDEVGQSDEVYMDTSKDLSGKMAVVRLYSSTSNNAEEMREQAFKTMNIDEMGIYNCDKILDDKKLIADYKGAIQ